ncbi:uncharacterized protein [Haliotis asinina]|uniref:uncharacterized protein n=1 Tax=Haliotis asinina TaxID=109174 RepID=UPI0035323781
MNVSSIKITLVCLSFVICFSIYFLYPVKQEISSDIVGTITNKIIQFIARNFTTKSDRVDCFLARKDSGINLLAQRLAVDNQESPETNAKKALFFDRLLQKEKMEFRNIINTFSEGVPTNITYFLYAGSLLGSYSHHGMIPWDDDLDIIVKEKDKPLLLTFLESLRPNYEHYTTWKMNWKLYNKKSQKAGSMAWRWPFVDIFFYSEHPSFIQDCRATYKKFNKTDVFPLIKRPFMGAMLPAPRHTRKVLELTYNIDLCVSNSYDHRLEKQVPSRFVVKLPCDLLKDKFPFVERKKSRNTSVEVLDAAYGKRSVFETTNIF